MAGVIYRPKGKAGEYSDFAVNLYAGCDHGCKYPCYAPSVLRMSKEDFSKPVPRKDIISRIEDQLERDDTPDGYILLCFTTDPYNRADVTHQITRKALELFDKHGCQVKILTKGGNRARRDLDIIERMRCRVEFGQTILFYSDSFRKMWEPNASHICERINLLKDLKKRGIRTWISLEPVIIPEEAVYLIHKISKWVDHWKVGKWNYHPGSKKINWPHARKSIVRALQEEGADYYIKEDLRNAK